ncbi:serine/threonine-protein kinase TIO-like [Cucumis melo var. makuwa]|uniref:Serine/threonine-protein kinase TIO-like n=1 Tax=Cucumis melo var. makuwa TaxID=1194695 RepID=A0A5D3E0G8_CUCMM|nr:serine/threonine-protein kinase TIO-like [Cucumis melo var. makuwa]TYK29396.1 serine/threonine-protein kinase TIO-like [Cucumis melo var. makuwa]
MTNSGLEDIQWSSLVRSQALLDKFRGHMNKSYILLMHAQWVSYIQRFDFTFKHQAGKENKVANALNRKGTLLAILLVEIVAFNHLPRLYENVEDLE